MNGKLEILFVDDREGIQTVVDAVNEGRENVRADKAFPQDVKAADLKAADLVLLDLKLGDWVVPAPALQQPQDGLGLASVVRSYHRRADHDGAVALLSSELDDLARGLSHRPSEHAVARLHNLEWAFDKGADTALPDRIVELAAASRLARRLWSSEDSSDHERLFSFLGLPGDVPWRSNALTTLNASQPPISDLGAVSRGQGVVRWLAHRILPHPGLLIDLQNAAVRLGLAPPVGGSEAETRLVELLDSARYRGALSGFVGRRWWRSGVLQLIADRNQGRPVITAKTAAALADELGHGFQAIPPGSVVCFDADLHPSSRVVEKHAAVRVRPDDWPVFSEPGYVAVADFVEADEEQQDRLRALVDPADIRLLP